MPISIIVKCGGLGTQLFIVTEQFVCITHSTVSLEETLCQSAFVVGPCPQKYYKGGSRYSKTGGGGGGGDYQCASQYCVTRGNTLPESGAFVVGPSPQKCYKGGSRYSKTGGGGISMCITVLCH